MRPCIAFLQWTLACHAARVASFNFDRESKALARAESDPKSLNTAPVTALAALVLNGATVPARVSACKRAFPSLTPLRKAIVVAMLFMTADEHYARSMTCSPEILAPLQFFKDGVIASLLALVAVYAAVLIIEDFGCSQWINEKFRNEYMDTSTKDVLAQSKLFRVNVDRVLSVSHLRGIFGKESLVRDSEARCYLEISLQDCAKTLALVIIPKRMAFTLAAGVEFEDVPAVFQEVHMDIGARFAAIFLGITPRNSAAERDFIIAFARITASYTCPVPDRLAFDELPGTNGASGALIAAAEELATKKEWAAVARIASACADLLSRSTYMRLEGIVLLNSAEISEALAKSVQLLGASTIGKALGVAACLANHGESAAAKRIAFAALLHCPESYELNAKIVQIAGIGVFAEDEYVSIVGLPFAIANATLALPSDDSAGLGGVVHIERSRRAVSNETAEQTKVIARLRDAYCENPRLDLMAFISQDCARAVAFYHAMDMRPEDLPRRFTLDMTAIANALAHTRLAGLRRALIDLCDGAHRFKGFDAIQSATWIARFVNNLAESARR